MIAYLRGRVHAIDADSAILDVGGVGYRLHCTSRTLHQLPAAGEAAELLVETVMREDGIVLYGFRNADEQRWFRLLKNIQGVGARLALSLLSALSPDELATAIAAQDRSALTRASGVGPRLAGRILAELKDRVVALGGESETARSGGPGADAVADAVSALVNLGYGRSEAYAAVTRARAARGGTTAVDQLIREALKELAP